MSTNPEHQPDPFSEPDGRKQPEPGSPPDAGRPREPYPSGFDPSGVHQPGSYGSAPQQPDPYQQQGPHGQGYPGQPNQYPPNQYQHGPYQPNPYQQGPYQQGRYGQGYPEQKSRLVAGLLGILLGSLGIHRFYLGYTTIGVVQIIVTFVTFGFGALWGFIEGILILVGAQSFSRDARGIPLKE
ncbi:hypothetical protein IWX65_001233 [Arthrobacter sp. CAN_A214]|uniref:TM2 domain-containing protein n=1 Tax=Arthrobacter sp. CAN_A214 TaxID=2787720 RepID=UPI0018CB6BD6